MGDHGVMGRMYGGREGEGGGGREGIQGVMERKECTS